MYWKKPERMFSSVGFGFGLVLGAFFISGGSGGNPPVSILSISSSILYGLSSSPS